MTAIRAFLWAIVFSLPPLVWTPACTDNSQPGNSNCSQKHYSADELAAIGWSILSGPMGEDMSERERANKAVVYLNQARDMGSTDALLDLGKAHATGYLDETLEEAFNAARKYLKMAYDHGEVSGALLLGDLYLDGISRGDELFGPDTEESLRWYTIAYSEGSNHAAERLGYYYMKVCNGRPSMIEMGLKYYEEAAANGSASAQAKLHQLESRGVGKVGD